MSNKKLVQGGKVFLAEERRFELRDILEMNGDGYRLTVSDALLLRPNAAKLLRR